MSDLIKHASQRTMLEVANGSIGFSLKDSFNGRLDRFAIDEGELKSRDDRLKELRKQDRERYDSEVEEAKTKFNSKNGWVRRKLRKVKFVPPEFEPSLETRAYQDLVKVGGTLKQHVDNLRQFPKAFEAMEQNHHDLYKEEARFRVEEATLRGRLRTYETDAFETSSLLEKLENYDQLQPEEKQLFREIVGIPIWHIDIRENYCRMLKEGLFYIALNRENDLADLEIITTISLASAQRQRVTLKQQAQNLWEIYNPARVEAARLSAAYKELGAAESATLATQAAGVLQSALEICERVRNTQEALEQAVEKSMNIFRAQRKLTFDDELSKKIDEAYQLTE